MNLVFIKLRKALKNFKFFEDKEEIKNLFNKANRDGFYSIVEKVRGVNNTKKALKDLFATKNKIVNNTLEFIASGSSTVGRLFPSLEFGEEDEKKKINFVMKNLKINITK